jgi:hypothetical protein
LAPELLELLDELPPEGRLLVAEGRELPPDGRLLRTEERELLPDGRLLRTEEREPPLEEPLLLTDGLELLPEDRELPTEPDRGIVYRPGLLPIVLRDPDAEPARLDEPEGEVVGLLYLDELDPGTTTGLDPPILSAPDLGVTSGRDVCEEPVPPPLDVVPPPVLYKVGR